MTAGFSPYKTAGGDSILQNDKSKNDGPPFEFTDLSYYIRLDGDAQRRRHLERHHAGSEGYKSLEAGLLSLVSAGATIADASAITLTDEQASSEWLKHLIRDTLIDQKGKLDTVVERNLPNGFRLHGRTAFHPSRLGRHADGVLYISSFAVDSEGDGDQSASGRNSARVRGLREPKRSAKGDFRPNFLALSENGD